MMDLFATRLNYKFPLYISPVPDCTAWSVDVLSVCWTALDAYAYPPMPLIARVLQKVQEDQSPLLLIAPLWPNQSLFPLLLHLLVDHPLELPNGPKLLKQSHSNQFHQSPQCFILHAWKLSGVYSRNEAFQQQCLAELPVAPRGSPLWRYTTPSGRSSLSGVNFYTRILSRPLPN
jgi:hypothetical protein